MAQPEYKEYKFFQHRSCEFFPCHTTEKPEDFNCLFCYCPLYALGKNCGGNFKLMENGIKDCSNCMVPHKRDNYDYMLGKIMELYDSLKEAFLSEKGGV